jgi:DNA modification methylase
MEELATRFEIKYQRDKRFVQCSYCDIPVERTIVTHLKKDHPIIWKRYVELFVQLRKSGYGYKKIMWHFGRAFSWTVVERELAGAGVAAVPLKLKSKFINFEPTTFSEEKTTLWSFRNAGKWAVHDASYRGNWAPEIPRNLILKYSREGDWVLDPFIGGGTTAMECLLLGRNCHGLDINKGALSLARQRLTVLKKRLRSHNGNHNSFPTVRFHQNDARIMKPIQSSSVQLVCTHPPYLDIIEYTRNNPADFSTITDPDRYIREMRKVFVEAYRCLKPGGVLCVLVADVRRSGKLIPLGFKLLNMLLDAYELVEIVIKEQHNGSTNYFWKHKPQGFLRIAHEYLFILKKSSEKE